MGYQPPPPLLITAPPSFSPPLLKSTNCPAPFFRHFPPYMLVFHDPPVIKIEFLSQSPYFSSLTPSHLLKVTKFFVKTSHFKFLPMKEKDIFVYKLFVYKYFKLVYFLCQNCTPSLKKATPSFPATLHQKLNQWPSSWCMLILLSKYLNSGNN